MKIDAYFPEGLRLTQAGAVAQDVERAGFAGMWVTETRHNPFLSCGAALTATQRVQVGSGIAVAFPRSPMVTAQAAWDLADPGGGRFVLRLGPQVKPPLHHNLPAPFHRP